MIVALLGVVQALPVEQDPGVTSLEKADAVASTVVNNAAVDEEAIEKFVKMTSNNVRDKPLGAAVDAMSAKVTWSKLSLKPSVAAAQRAVVQEEDRSGPAKKVEEAAAKALVNDESKAQEKIPDIKQTLKGVAADLHEHTGQIEKLNTNAGVDWLQDDTHNLKKAARELDYVRREAEFGIEQADTADPALKPATFLPEDANGFTGPK